MIRDDDQVARKFSNTNPARETMRIAQDLEHIYNCTDPPTLPFFITFTSCIVGALCAPTTDLLFSDSFLYESLLSSFQNNTRCDQVVKTFTCATTDQVACAQDHAQHILNDRLTLFTCLSIALIS